MEREYAKLGLTRWPFPVVPQPEYCTFIAARDQLKSDVHQMVDALAQRDTSSIQLLWAWFGAGKTHTLHYLNHYATHISALGGNNRLFTVYTEFPKGAKSFLDLYKSLLVSLDFDVLSDAFLEVWTSPGAAAAQRRLMQTSPDLFAALHVLSTGVSQAQVVAQRWLRGDSVPLSDLRRIGISQRLGTSEEAARAIASIVDLFNLASGASSFSGARLLWIIDEFQRIDRAGARGIDDINAGLHSTFNACPAGLTYIFSFSGKPQPKGLPDWFSRELRDRIGRTKVMVLPPMSTADALTFVREVLEHFRFQEFPLPSRYFPFSEASCKMIIADVQSKAELKPRAIMQAFSAVLDEAAPLFESNEMSVISPEFAKRSLQAYTLVTSDDPGDAG